MTFAGGVVYCWIQAYLTYHSRSNGLNSDATLHARVLIAFFVTLFFTMGILSISTNSSCQLDIRIFMFNSGLVTTGNRTNFVNLGPHSLG